MNKSYTAFLVILLGLGTCSFVNELNPTVYAQSPSVTNSTAEDYFNRGKQKVESNPKEAIADLSDSIRLNPNNPNAYYQRGIARYNLIRDAYDEPEGWLKVKDIEEEEITDSTEAIRTGETRAYFVRGLARQFFGDKKGAEQDLAESSSYLKARQGLAGDAGGSPIGNAEEFYTRGITLQRQEKKKQAVNEFQKAAILFQVQGNLSKYREVRNLIQKVIL